MINATTQQITPKKAAAKCSLAEANFLKKYVYFVPAEVLRTIPSTDLTKTGENNSEILLFTIEATNYWNDTLLIEAWDKSAPFFSKFFR